MAWTQNAFPNLATTENPGWCLRFVQSVYGTPRAYPSATAAWRGVGQKFETRDLPNVSVPVFFSWYGDLGDGQGSIDWGHVACWIPSEGKFLSSPLSWSQGYSQSWVNSLEDFERILGCKYVGFGADMNGMQIATFTAESLPTPVPVSVGITYTVALGDNLWNIATQFYNDGARYPEIYNANIGIIGENPNLILPGQVLTIPGV